MEPGSGGPTGPTVQDCIQQCQLGTSVTKFGRSGKPAARVIFISADGQAVCWQSKRKRPQDSRLLFSDIERVQRGQHTATFARYGKQYQSAALKSLSIVCASGRTLDVIFRSEEETDTWLAALEACQVAHLRAAHYADSDRKRLCRLFYEEASGASVSRSTSGSGLLAAMAGGSRGSASVAGAAATAGAGASLSMWKPSTWLRRSGGGGEAGTDAGDGSDEDLTISYAQLKALLRRLNIVYKGRDGTRRLREVFSMVVASEPSAGVVGDASPLSSRGGGGGPSATGAASQPSRGRSMNKAAGPTTGAAAAAMVTAGSCGDDGATAEPAAAAAAAAAASMPAGRLGLSGFLRLVDLLRDRPDITAVFNEWCAGDRLEPLQLGAAPGASAGGAAGGPDVSSPMPIATFHKFLVHAQQERLATLDDAKRLAALFGPAMPQQSIHSRYGSSQQLQSMAGAADAEPEAGGGEGSQGGPPATVPGASPPGIPHSYYANVSGITLPGFIAYLTSGHNAAFNPSAAAHDEGTMTAPLAHYWIASSHNTYLEGDQFASSSSVNQYITTLAKGCRCVELDCWDGPAPTYEPVIYHGRTLTSRIAFQDVVQALADYGFQASPYPLILSLEVHCSPRQQERMVEILEGLLGEAIARPPSHVIAAVSTAMGHDEAGGAETPLAAVAWMGCEHASAEDGVACRLCAVPAGASSPSAAAVTSRSWEQLPSPAALAGKVLVKAKLKKKKAASGTAAATPLAAGSEGAAAGLEAAPATPSPAAAPAAAVATGPRPTSGSEEAVLPAATVPEVTAAKCFPSGGAVAGGAGSLPRAPSLRGPMVSSGGVASVAASSVPSSPRRSTQRGLGGLEGGTPAAAATATAAAAGEAAAVGGARPPALSLPPSSSVAITIIPRLNAALYLPTLKFVSWEDCQARHTPWHMVSLKESHALKMLQLTGETAAAPLPPSASSASALVRASPVWGASAAPPPGAEALPGLNLGPASTPPATPGSAVAASAGVAAVPEAAVAAASVYASPGYAAMARHTSSRLIRIYPKVSRLNSSNFNPAPFWAAGVQMVALNYQTADVPMRLNRALFRLNGRCGYVLKPAHLRQGGGGGGGGASGGVAGATSVPSTLALKAKAAGLSVQPVSPRAALPVPPTAGEGAAPVTQPIVAPSTTPSAAEAAPLAVAEPEATPPQVAPEALAAETPAVAAPAPSLASAPSTPSSRSLQRWLSTPLRHSASMSPESHPAAAGGMGADKVGAAGALGALDQHVQRDATGFSVAFREAGGGRAGGGGSGAASLRPFHHHHLSTLSTTISRPDARSLIGSTGPSDPTYATVMAVAAGPSAAPAATKRLLLTVEIMGAQHLPKRPGASPEAASRVPSPFVSLTVFGGHTDPQKVKTRAIPSNGFNPAWRESFTFVVPDPSVSILYLSVNDQAEVKGSHFLGYFAVPLQALRWGYRCCPLRDAVGKKFPLSTILARFTATPLNDP